MYKYSLSRCLPRKLSIVGYRGVLHQGFSCGNLFECQFLVFRQLPTHGQLLNLSSANVRDRQGGASPAHPSHSFPGFLPNLQRTIFLDLKQPGRELMKAVGLIVRQGQRISVEVAVAIFLGPALVPRHSSFFSNSFLHVCAWEFSLPHDLLIPCSHDSLTIWALRTRKQPCLFLSCESARQAKGRASHFRRCSSALCCGPHTVAPPHKRN